MNIGIDFGSTYSMVARYNDSLKNVEAITFAEGEPASVPSVVSISRKGQVTCGKGAKDQVGKKTVRIFEAFKMLLTENNQEMLRRRGYDQEYTPRYIARCYLESLLRGVQQRMDKDGGSCDGFEHVVICVPEIWGKKLDALNSLDGRAILRDILQHDIDIPVNHVRVVTEPEAASAFIAYHYEEESKKAFNGHLLLIDYGGGTLDLTLTQVTSDGKGSMEIGYRDGGGAGENHPDKQGNGSIGSAGIAYMQDVLVRALRDQGLLEPDQAPDYTSVDFTTAMRDLETQLKSVERIQEIEDVFGTYGSYRKIRKILKEEPMHFTDLEYDGEEVEVTFQHLFQSYQAVIEHVLEEETARMNPKVWKHIGADPCTPEAGNNDDFKIALVGGFGSFYLVKQHIAEIYNLDANPEVDLRTKHISANKRELAISLGAALLAAQKLVLQKTARFSIGIYSGGEDAGEEGQLRYGIKYHQTVEPGQPYFMCYNDDLPDVPSNRVVYGGLYGNIKSFAITFSERRNHGGIMKLKPEILKRMQELPQEGFWNLGFSMDESDVVCFHIVPRSIAGLENHSGEIKIPLESYIRMFDLTAIKEVTI